MRARNVRLERAPRLARDRTHRTLLEAVEVRLNVMLHLGLVLVLPVADEALPDRAPVPRTRQTLHFVRDQFVQGVAF